MPILVTIPRLLCKNSPSIEGPKVNFERWAEGESEMPNWPVRTTSPSAKRISRPAICWWCVAVGRNPVPLSTVCSCQL
jgi:hypothetical protein